MSNPFAREIQFCKTMTGEIRPMSIKIIAEDHIAVKLNLTLWDDPPSLGIVPL